MTGKFGTSKRAAAIGALALFAAAGAFALTATPASALAPTDRYVATTGDDAENDCTDPNSPCQHIQYAVDQSGAGDTIHVGAGDYPETVTIGIPLTVVGAGSGATNVSGNNDNGPSFALEPVEQSMIDVTLEDLSASHNTVAEGVTAFGTNLTITDSVISDDQSAGVLAVLSTLHMSGSVVSDIVTGQSETPQLAAAPFGDGTGVLLVGSVASIDTSTVRDNEASGIQLLAQALLGAPVREVAAAVPAPTTALDLHASTVSGNDVGGVVNYGGAATVATSTVSGNLGGGVVSFGTGSTAAISNSTITATKPFPESDGSGEQGGVIDLSTVSTSLAPSAQQREALAQYVTAHAADKTALVKRASRQVAAAAPAPASGTTVVGSIVAAQAGVADCFGTVVDNGYNLSSDAANSCGFAAAKHDLTKTDPKLGALADNGGPTLTHKPLKGSPAIDAIPGGNANCVAGAMDQRGVARPQPVGNACDVGAVELAANAIVIHPDALPDGTVGEAYHATITATGGAYPTYTFTLAPGSSLPDGLSMDEHGHITGTPTKAGTFPFTVSVNDPVLKDYTIVIDDAATNGAAEEPIAATGAPVVSMTAVGAGATFAGLLLMVGAGLIGRRPGRHRARS